GTRDPGTGEFRGSTDNKKLLERVSQEIAAEINFVVAVHSQSYLKERASESKLTSTDLFRNTKADWHKVVTDGDLDRLFVKTKAYYRAKRSSKAILVGRKGSGKSTVTQVRNITEASSYSGIINVQADAIRLTSLYHLTTFRQITSDIRNVVTTYTAFQMTWLAFFFFCVLEHAFTAKGDGRRVREYIADVGSNRVSQLFSGQHMFASATSERKNAYFVRAFEGLTEYLSICINDSDNIGSMLARLTPTLMLSHLFGPQLVDAVVRYILASDKPFLVTLDDFDSSFDQFRRECLRNKEDMDEASRFELEWLRALLHLVLRPSIDSFGAAMNKKFHFCLTVPKDRYLELRATERDGYIYNNQYTPLDWTGIELAILLRKRLEEDSGFRIDRSRKKHPWEYLNDVLTDKYPFLPTSIRFTYNGREEELDLFMYVLRHTFWRPREVLQYYGALVAVGHEVARHRYELNASIIRRTIRDEAFNVVRTEFFKEFDTTVNIETIVAAFRKMKQFCSYDEVASAIHSTEFVLAAGEVYTTISSKIRYLYSIGFLGVQLLQSDLEFHCMLHEHAFCFNEGELWFELKPDEDLKSLTYIIHPVFKEFLELDSSGNSLVLKMDWAYLSAADSIVQT
ncbi:MAG TPA: hypothetical protein VK171_13600, partial [Fimbriimonas sp.]|nr:hypothetical protein [Fimbriimonas sp.]